MGLSFRSPIVKTSVQKSGGVPVTITLDGLKYWDRVSSDIIRSIVSNVSRLDLTTVQGQTSAYIRCAPVASIVGRLAEYSMNGRYVFVDNAGKEVTKQSSTGLFKIFKKPNFYQTWAEYYASIVTEVKLHGQSYIMPIVPEGFIFKPENVTQVSALPNWAVTPIYTGKSVYQDDITGVVSGYRVSFLNKVIPTDQMIVIRDSSPAVYTDSKRIFEGQSRLYSLSDQVNNLIAIQDAIYNMTTRRGAMGALVPEVNKDSTGFITPLDPKEQQEVIDAFLNYGIGTNHTAPFQVLKNSMRWVQMAMNIGDLKLYEGKDSGIVDVAMAMNVSTSIIGIKDVKYDNQAAAEKSAYQSAVIPTVNNICQCHNEWFNLQGIELKAFFDHLEIFQKAKKDEADALNAMTSALDKPYKVKVITMQEYRNMIAEFMPVGVQFDPLIPDGDQYFDGSPTQTIVAQ